MRSAYHGLEDLPETIPVFPLAGAILFPRARLPLNVFEPRYLAMVDAALAGARVIGMIQPSEVEGKRPALYPVGCLGRLTSFAETGDGRYLITLTGVIRFRIAQELDAVTPFRQVHPRYDEFLTDLKSPPESEVPRDRLIAALKLYLRDRNVQIDWQAVEKAPDEHLLNATAMLCPFQPAEKQALLETHTLAARNDTLLTLLEMANLAPGGDDGRSVQ